jgi:NAD(P)H dehydrogenase (quinone)
VGPAGVCQGPECTGTPTGSAAGQILFATWRIQPSAKGDRIIAITGATGHLGRLVVASLIRKVPPANVIAAVRNPDKAKDLASQGVQVRKADYDTPEDWDAALRGAEKVLLISSSEVSQRSRHHRTVIDAAKRAGVKLLAYTSILHADTSALALAKEHSETEASIRASGIPFVLLRNGWYMENYAPGVKSALARGSVYGCASNGRISAAGRADYAEAAAVVLTANGQAGRVYELGGDTGFTMAELAAEISRQSGKVVAYTDLSEPDYKKALIGAGLPEGYAALLSDSDTGISKGALFDERRQLSGLIGRPTTPLAAAVRGML